MILIIALSLSMCWVVFSPGFESMTVLLGFLIAFHKDNISIIKADKYLSLHFKPKCIKNIKEIEYSFIKEKYITPLIIKDLEGWLSDVGTEIISINISSSNESNRYFGKISVKANQNSNPIVTAESDEGTFSYQYLGCSFSGKHLIRTWDWGGGSGVFESIMLVTMHRDYIHNYDIDNHIDELQLIVSKIGSICLGDRYDGTVKFKWGRLTISACSLPWSIRSKKETIYIF